MAKMIMASDITDTRDEMYDTSTTDISSTEPFRRKSFLLKCHYVECPLRRNIFCRTLSTKYFVPIWLPYCVY